MWQYGPSTSDISTTQLMVDHGSRYASHDSWCSKGATLEKLMLYQGGHRLWKTGKMMKKNSLNGKIREFDKNKKIREKSGNFTIAVIKN